MPATILDAPAHSVGYPASFAVSSGTNRIAFVAVCHSSGTDAAPATGATLGGQTMSVLATVDSTGHNVCMTVFYLLEAGVAAMSGSTLSISGGTTTNSVTVIWSTSNSDQTAPAVNSAATVGTSGSVSLARVADSVTIGVCLHNVTSDNITGLTNPSEDANFGTTNITCAYGSETDSARTANFTWANAFNRDNASVVINAAPPSGLTITSVTPSSFDSGIAGIVIAGAGFGASQGSSTVDIGGQAQTVTAWSDTSITITSARGSNSMGAGQLKVTIR